VSKPEGSRQASLALTRSAIDRPARPVTPFLVAIAVLILATIPAVFDRPRSVRAT
jgi:hypothetical protein